MSQAFDALKVKLSNADLAQAKDVIIQAKQAYDDGQIDENLKTNSWNLQNPSLEAKGSVAFFKRLK